METSTRKPRAARREQVVGAVLRIVGENGIGSLTTTALARDIGVSSGALFRHFDTRDEILEATVQYVAETIDGTFPEATLPALERIAGLAAGRIETLRREPGIAWFLHSDQAALNLPPDAVERLRQCARRTRRFVLDALAEGTADGSIRGDVDPEHLLVMVLGTVHAFLAQARSPKQKPTQRTDAIVRALVRVIAPTQS